MKFKVLYILAIVGFMSLNAQSVRGARIGYIDTEYILENVPNYQQATAQLETKLTKWKSEIEKKLADVETKKKSLENEKILLTKELYEERLEDISYEEKEILDYQQKRFGPGGDMVLQKTQLMQPVQDQIWSAVREIAEKRKYDFVFDKNSDFLMLYSAERFDISDAVLKIITRANTREQAKNKKERKALEEEEAVPSDRSTKDERAKALAERKAEREALLEERRLEREKALEERRQKQKAAREAKLKEREERRQKALDARKKQETPKTTEKDSTASSSAKSNEKGAALKKSDSTKAKTPAEIQKEKRAKALADREKRKKELEDRKKKILEQRKKAREERLKQLRKNDSIRKAKAKEKKKNDN